MARNVRDANLETRAARSRLKPSGKPYFRAIEPGLHLGYRKPSKGAGRWVLRHYRGNGAYELETVGTADDFSDADGVAILSYWEAQSFARQRMVACAHLAAGKTTRLTVRDVVESYLVWMEGNRRSGVDARKRAEAVILPALGDIKVDKLTTDRICEWHLSLTKKAPRARTGRGKEQRYRKLGQDEEYQRRRKSTANRTLTTLKAALNRAWREGKIESAEAWRRVQPFHGVDAVERWARKNSRDIATGIRLENGLAVIDIDIDDEAIITEITIAIFDAVPRLESQNAPLLIRRGKGFKEAWFVRTEKPFTRIATHRFIAPGEATERTQQVEIFGGASHRQFGAYGPHTINDDGKVEVLYRWEDGGPATVPLAELPVLSKDEFFAVLDAAERVLKAAGWMPVVLSRPRESKARRVYDLTDGMIFQCLDGADRTVAEAKEWAKSVNGGRCSASWLEGPSAENRTRCMLSITRGNHLCVHDFSTGMSHIEAAEEPRDIIGDLARFADLHRARSDR